MDSGREREREHGTLERITFKTRIIHTQQHENLAIRKTRIVNLRLSVYLLYGQTLIIHVNRKQIVNVLKTLCSALVSAVKAPLECHASRSESG